MLRTDTLLRCLVALAVATVSAVACSGSDTNSLPAAAGAGAGAGAAGNPGSSGGTGQASGGHAMGGKAGSATNAGGAGAAHGGVSGVSGVGGSVLEGGDSGVGGAPVLGPCGSVAQLHALAPGIHVELCSPIVYATNPPSSGQHYPTWADFGVYDFPLPRGYWMHNLEHGAVVVTYHCPDGCDDELTEAAAWLSGLTPDAVCPAGPPRVLLVPDPLLDVRWAASSWGATLRADCFDADTFSDFYTKHAGDPRAPEGTLCGTGVDLRLAGADTCGAK